MVSNAHIFRQIPTQDDGCCQDNAVMGVQNETKTIVRLDLLGRQTKSMVYNKKG